MSSDPCPVPYFSHLAINNIIRLSATTMFKRKQSFFERITGTIPAITVEEDSLEIPTSSFEGDGQESGADDSGQLAVDVYQTPNEIIVQAMIAGVKPETLSIEISREIVTVSGSRQRYDDIVEEDYFFQELYWGSFSRTILLPAEVEADEAEAIEKNGLLTIRLPKINKEKKRALKVKSV
ncbi:MAG: hypothetical protein COV10_01445 [Candidatus Vogelbacteria bacterium CG10_big_fil_rev_8_21_14_0_10_51_16]|uniref:SHSP domain-containing protein n=1 Tax=Candidatus Vogelbacteria bacterium CG10_big_fil_rev_8_21_14_0_10_51_16 TaxID=1975045 RepID=A0A2H0REY3_9BACT|nr:MAG: hypothetical protein COV10_01445 [Candidatus Vogelbacteria bacterium CG10_big_fil_rev_8_21_14_0_10_51_16]